MKKTVFFAAKVLIGCALLLCTSLSALAVNRNWRLNPDPDAKADFTSINDAMQDERVIPGDFLILDPGYYSGQQTVTKENITISGTGYFLTQNYNWPDAAQATIEGLSFSKAGKIQGCNVGELALCDSLEVFRCYLNRVEGGTRYTRKRVKIESCFLNYVYGYDFENSTFRNNIFISGLVPFFRYETSMCNNCIIEYNTVFSSQQKGFGTIKNKTGRKNIFIIKNEDGSNRVAVEISDNNDFSNNVLSTAPENANAAYPNNKYVGATVENTFVDEIIADRYYLREDSPAKGYASDGGDCGAFGGRMPYVISGILQYMPHITNIDIPAKPTDGSLTIKMKMVIRDE